jgi:histidine ammonia-lyase
MIEGRFGLPRLLLKETGLHSGFMIPQYTTAALVSENKSLCFPASADSIPTSLGQEDHVSMGAISGRKLHQVIDNLEYILAIEMLYATQALEFRRPLRSTPFIENVVNQIRKHVPFTTEDRIFAQDIYTIHQLILSQEFKSTIQEYEKFNLGFEEFTL